jgi:hypothetical protein
MKESREKEKQLMKQSPITVIVRIHKDGTTLKLHHDTIVLMPQVKSKTQAA